MVCVIAARAAGGKGLRASRAAHCKCAVDAYRTMQKCRPGEALCQAASRCEAGVAVTAGRTAATASTAAADTLQSRPSPAINGPSSHLSQFHTCMRMAFYNLRAAMIGALDRNRGAEAVLEQCGGPPDSKGSAYGGGRSARAREGAFKRISVAGKGLTFSAREKMALPTAAHSSDRPWLACAPRPQTIHAAWQSCSP